MDRWENIAAVLRTDAVSIAWDTCHKIYVLLDEPQHKLMASYGYDPLYRIDAIGGPDAALAILRQWWDESCGLRFINSVRTVPGDPNDGFTDLIPQFAEEDD